MPDRLEELIKLVYRKWKQGRPKVNEPHPDEEAFVCFLEGRLPQEELNRMKAHLINCSRCSELLAVQLKLKPQGEKEAPKGLIEGAKSLVGPGEAPSVIETILLLKEKALEILSTTGDILVGQEFVPSPVLRSRKITEFKDEVTIVKDFRDIRVEVKIENKGGQAFDLIIFVKDKETNRVIKDLRVTLLKEDLELESYLSASDKVVFEHVSAGKYIVEVSNVENKIASILLDIRK